MLSYLPHHHLQVASHHSSNNRLSHVQNKSFPVRWLLFVLLLLVATCSWYLLHHHVSGHHEISTSSRAQYLQSVYTRGASSPLTKTVDNNIEHSVVIPSQRDRIRRYLLALQNSVSIVTLPETKSLQQAIHDCEQHHKPSLLASKHQHSVELHFPHLLNAFSELSQRGNLLHFLHTPSKTSPDADSVTPSNAVKEWPDALFYLTQSYFYTVVYCTHKDRDKEDWKAGLVYWKEVATFLIRSSPWQHSHGLDHFIVASHPKSGPQALDPYDINAFAKQSFLRTDFDVSGHANKDVIIPYYVTSTSWEDIETMRINTKLSHPQSYLLVFIGSDNPKHGFRSQLSAALQTLPATDIFVSIDQTIPTNEYQQYLLHAKFCLTLRGDTASSSRLFAILDLGCIPVIISDWMLLPFEHFLDYNKFTIRFSESIVEDIPRMVNYLRTLSEEDKQHLRNGVLEARNMLLYHDTSSSASLSLLNPISLTLMELLQQREDYCQHLQDTQSNPMCVQITQRLEYANQHIQSLQQHVLHQGEDDLRRQKKV